MTILVRSVLLWLCCFCCRCCCLVRHGSWTGADYCVGGGDLLNDPRSLRPHQPLPLGPLRYNERKERDLGGKQELQIPSARSPAWSTLPCWSPNVRRSCLEPRTDRGGRPHLGRPWQCGSVVVWLPAATSTPAASGHKQERTSLAPSQATVLPSRQAPLNWQRQDGSQVLNA